MSKSIVIFLICFVFITQVSSILDWPFRFPEIGKMIAQNDVLKKGTDGKATKYRLSLIAIPLGTFGRPPYDIAEPGTPMPVTLPRVTRDVKPLEHLIESQGQYIQTDRSVRYYLNWPDQIQAWSNKFPDDGPICPQFKTSLKVIDRKLTKMTMSRPMHPEGLFVNGYLCESQVWISRCKETWYFSYDEKREIKYDVPVYEKCLESLRLYQKGDPIELEHPLMVCYWNAEHVESRVYHVITPHVTTINPYRNEVQDPLLANRTCQLKNSHCSTIRESTIWIRDSHDPLEGICNLKNWNHAEVDVSEVDSETSIQYRWRKGHHLEGPEFGMKLLESGCQMTFCGIRGVRFTDGEWWTSLVTDPTRNQTKSNQIYNAISDLKTCSAEESSDIGIAHPNFQDPVRKKEIGNVVKALQCSQTIGKLLSGEELTPLDLSSLAPDIPGPGIVYKLKWVNDSGYILHWAHATYKLIRYHPRQIHPGNISIGYDHLNKEMLVNEWENTPVPSIKIGHNGVLKKIVTPGNNFSILVPQMMLQMGEVDNSFVNKIPVEHIKLEQINDEPIIDDDEKNMIKNDEKDVINRENVVDGVGSWLHKIGEVITGWTSGGKSFILMILMLCSGYLIIKLSLFCYLKVKRRKSIPDGMETKKRSKQNEYVDLKPLKNGSRNNPFSV
ncbi:glycoprotein [Inhangapi virus]|uniref:G n=1 Tax=Inhangapi virus TaxID=1620892 RepID=A0A0D3R1G5_9RHAB|nr:G [Inhangapi virus] [Inhangapi virus]YP_010796339.1 glycoprotein [Inhangapi virus]AJR28342.1 glycoprotein [Inhangapi virus]ALJ94020.1 G [Inhangapi virus] [Inhangapi virus]